MINTHHKISIAILVVIMFVSFVILSMPSLSAEEYGYNVNDNPFPNDENYVGYNLYDFNNVQMYKVGDGTMSYRITDDGLHIWAESNSDNLYQSYLDLQKINVKKNTKYVIAVRIDGYQNTGAIRVASNGDGANRNNLVTVKAKPYTYQYNEFTTIDDTEYLQLYYYPKYEKSGEGNSDYRNIMIYEVNDDNGYKPYEPYGGWYKFGVDNAASEMGSYVLNNFYYPSSKSYKIPLFKTKDYIYHFSLGTNDRVNLIIMYFSVFYYDSNTDSFKRTYFYYRDSDSDIFLSTDVLVFDFENTSSIISDFYLKLGESSVLSDYYYFEVEYRAYVDNVPTYTNLTDSSFDLPLSFLNKEVNNMYYNYGVARGEKNSISLLNIFSSSLNGIGDFFMKFLSFEVLGISLLEILSGVFIVIILLWTISFLR